MAFRQPTVAPSRQNPITPLSQAIETSSPASRVENRIEESQEWILFSPVQDDSTLPRTQTISSQHTPGTAGLSRVSDLGSLDTVARTERIGLSIEEEERLEDRELDSLDDGLHAFREPSVYRTTSNQGPGGVLPAHDGLGTFAASSSVVQEQLWQHEQYNPKRKFEGQHRRRSSAQRRLDTIDEFESHINEEKRMRIEKWRMEQSEALVEEIEKETRRSRRRTSGKHEVSQSRTEGSRDNDILGTTPKASILNRTTSTDEQPEEAEPFWRRITRRFIRDVIGIDEPLLSVILGESLPIEAFDSKPIEPPAATILQPSTTISQLGLALEEDGWRERLLHRIARELGVFVNQISPQYSAFSTYVPSGTDNYAGIPITGSNISEDMKLSETDIRPQSSPSFRPTAPNFAHAASWGLDEDAPASTSSPTRGAEVERLRREMQYWERELDVKMVFRYLQDRFLTRSSTTAQQSADMTPTSAQESARRVAIIRQHHPLVARAHQSSARLRSEARGSLRKTSSCASESVRSSRRASLVRSGGSSRNYWDIGGSVGSGSIIASGGMMGAWGEI